MTRLLLVAGVLAAAVLAGRSTLASSGTTDVRVDCKARAIDVYLWPHGHQNVKAYKFPRYPAPHLEVYKRGSFSSKSFFVFLAATSYNYANTCDLATNPLPTRWGGGPKTTVRATRRVRCTFPAAVQIKIVPEGGKAAGGLRVARGGTPNEVLKASIRAGGSTLTYDSRYCKASAVPGVE